MLALADKNGEVQGSVPGIARMAGVSVDAARAAIERFLAPDPDSRTRDDEGRRIEVIDGGWHLLNHKKYRDMASDADRAEKARLRQQRKREKDRRNNVTLCHAPVTRESHQIPQAEADTDTNTNNLLLDVGETKPPKVGRKPSQRLVSGEGEDALWLADLAKDPAYVGIDVALQLGKMQRWCEVNRKEPTRRRFVNWLNRTEKPLAVSGSYRSKNQAYDAESQTAGKTGDEIGKF